jgi:hypothetical protein
MGIVLVRRWGFLNILEVFVLLCLGFEVRIRGFSFLEV